MRKKGKKKRVSEICFLPIHLGNKRYKNLKKSAVILVMALLILILFCVLESNIKGSTCRLVIFIRNIIVNIIAGEFPDFSVV